MSTRAEPFRMPLERDVRRNLSRVEETAAEFAPEVWNPERFAAEQIRSLVRQIFLSESPQACRQVVISAVDAKTDIGPLCLQIAETLFEQTGGTVCIVDKSQVGAKSETFSGRRPDGPDLNREASGALRDSSRQVASQVWALPGEVLWVGYSAHPAELLRRRLDQLRAEFDFSVVEAPAAGTAGLLGQLSDGVILVVEAHSTRRLAAQKARDNLRAADARLLGTVLSERRFPIPEKLYRRL